MLRAHQESFEKLIAKQGVSAGIVHLAVVFQSFQVQMITLCAAADLLDDYEAGCLRDSVGEALTQARLRLHEVGGWIDLAGNTYRSLGATESRKARSPEG